MRTNVTPSDPGFCLISFTRAKIRIRILVLPQNVLVLSEICFWIAQFSLSCRALTRWIIVTGMIKEVESDVSGKNVRFPYRRALYSLLFFSFCGPEQSDFLGRKNDSCSHFIETLIILIIVFIPCSFVRVWLNSIPHVGNLLIWFWSVS